jgi:hypothetical protein
MGEQGHGSLDGLRDRFIQLRVWQPGTVFGITLDN